MNNYSLLKLSILAILLFALTPFSWGATDCNAVTEISKTECQALLDLYNSTDGPNWSNKSGWNETDTPCSWFGITCNNGRLTDLFLEKNGLNGTLPNSLGNLSNLTYLNLSPNNITGSIPESLGNLSNLTVLHLYSNNIIGSIPESLGNLSQSHSFCQSDR